MPRCDCICCQIEGGRISISAAFAVVAEDFAANRKIFFCTALTTVVQVPEVYPIPMEGLRFFVQSRSRLTHRFLVDLEAIGGLGWCGCENFHFQRFPEFRRARKVSDEYRCWHLKRARSWLADAMIAKLGRAMDEQPAIDQARAAARQGQDGRRVYYLDPR